MNPNDVFNSMDHSFGELHRAMNRLREDLAVKSVDEDGQLAEFARMLALKRGCRRGA